MRLLPQDPGVLPKAGEAFGFLERGGSFALLSILVLGGGIVMFFGGRAFFRLLKDFLGELLGQQKGQTKLLETQTKLLTDLHSEAKVQRESSQATARLVEPWGSPEWLRERIKGLEARSDEIKAAIAELRLDVAKLHQKPPA